MDLDPTSDASCERPLSDTTDLTVDQTEMDSQLLALRDRFVSPALQQLQSGQVAPSEIKFLLDEGQAQCVELLLRSHLIADPHADTSLIGSGRYRVTTLYCDTPDFETFRRAGGYKRRKYRLRRYGQESRLFLERKTRRGEHVRKHRTTVDLEQLRRLSEPWTTAGTESESWSGEWFQKQLVRRRLQPVCNLEYLRTALVGDIDGSSLRVTLDRELRGSISTDWQIEFDAPGVPFLAGGVVVEFKFCGPLPALFKSVMHDLKLVPGGVSKYRHCVQTLGIADRSPFHA